MKQNGLIAVYQNVSNNSIKPIMFFKKLNLSLNKTIFFLFFFVAISYSLISKEYSINGKVIDKESGKAIPGASISIIGTHKGTYSSSTGKFKLPFVSGSVEIKVNSIGYESETIKIAKNPEDTILVRLKASQVNLEGIEKTADIEADEIVKRAIERKKDNISKLKTFKGQLYSKLVFEMGGSAFDKISSENNSLVMSAAVGNRKVEEKYKMFLLETFSNIMIDYDKKVSRTHIIQRRQTSNLNPTNNVMAIANFINFYDEKIQFLNAELITPLNKNALEYYNYKLIDRSKLDDRYVYILELTPKSELFPLFEGTMKIVEGSYNLVEMDVRPSKSTAVAFVKDVSLNQKFTEVERGLWHPNYLEAKGKAKVEVVKNFFDLEMDLTATSIYNEIELNEALPDSIYTTEIKRKTTVDSTADSAKSEFWDKNSMREISEREKEMYKKVDSLVVRSDSIKINKSPWNWNILPNISFNRVSSLVLGINPEFSFKRYSLQTSGSYSFGLKRPFGSMTLYIPVYDTGRYNIGLFASVYSDIDISSSDRSQSVLINTIVAALLHYDNYDYFRSDGWAAGLNFRYRTFTSRISLDYSNQFSLNKSTDQSLFENKYWQENHVINDSYYRNVQINLNYTSSFFRNPNGSSNFTISLKGLSGRNVTDNINYSRAEGDLDLYFPLFSTGYTPISMNLSLNGGFGTKNLPVQYQFKMATQTGIQSNYSCFYSAPPAFYGGTEYFSSNLQLFLSDIWWRALRLPLYEGRGLDLTLDGSAARFFNKSNEGYQSTSTEFYSEIGFGISKIPTYFSNVFYLSFDARWGIGKPGKGRFGWAIGLSAPF